MSSLMNMVSKLTRGTRTTGRARPGAPQGMGMRRGAGHATGHAPRARVGGGTSSVEGIARRLLHKAR